MIENLYEIIRADERRKTMDKVSNYLRKRVYGWEYLRDLIEQEIEGDI